MILLGFTAWPGMRPEVLLPLFSFAKTTLHSDILLTPLEQYRDTEGWDAVWEKKLFNRAVWRGSTTGIWFDRGTWWRRSQRVRLYFLSKDKTGSQKTRFDGVGVESQVGKESIVEREVKNEVLMNRYLDFAFSGKQNQCTQKDGTCDALKKVFEFERAMGWNEANEYKYMLDLDGNAWSGRFHRLLASNSAVLKSTIFPEWFVVPSDHLEKLVTADFLIFLFLAVVLGIQDGFSLGSSECPFDITLICYGLHTELECPAPAISRSKSIIRICSTFWPSSRAIWTVATDMMGWRSKLHNKGKSIRRSFGDMRIWRRVSFTTGRTSLLSKLGQ